VPCTITGRTDGDTYIYVFDGALDTEAAREVAPLARQSFLGGAKKLVFDLERVPFVASMGLGVFVTAIQSFPGKVVFAALQPYVRQTFKLARLDELAIVCKSVADALRV
jgi:anti-anti-sigma factor